MMDEANSSETIPNPLLNVVLFQPEIPQNTGNIGRLCAYTGIRLHLIHPLGFALSEKHIRRSGMDYWDALDKCEHESWDTFWNGLEPGARVWLSTTRGTQSHWSVQFQPGDYLLFGNEGHGCPERVHQAIGGSRSIKIPRLVPGLRSLNLSTSVGIVVYEALKSVKDLVNFDVY
jgi:tRNA (cytidine/uridine-2'-O-)-methyltransferase